MDHVPIVEVQKGFSFKSSRFSHSICFYR